MSGWTRRDVLRLPLGAALAGVAGSARGSEPLPLPLPRVNGGIGIQPLRRLGSDPRQPVIVPELVDLQMQAVYELGFEALRITLAFGRFSDDLLAAIPYVRAARALGIDVLGVLADFGGYELPQALFSIRTRAPVLATHLALFSGPVTPAPGVARAGTLALQVLNEPTHSLGLAPDIYVQEFLAPVYAELKRQAPELRVLAAAEVGNADGVLRLRHALEAGLERHCDAVAYHVYDRAILPHLHGLTVRPVWVTESGVVGTAQHLVWVRDVFPQIRQQIGGVAQVFYFELFDLQPDGFRVLDISGDQVAGFHASVESAALHAYWSQRVRDAAGAGARASYRELIPDITRYFPTAEDLRLIAQTPLS